MRQQMWQTTICKYHYQLLIVNMKVDNAYSIWALHCPIRLGYSLRPQHQPDTKVSNAKNVVSPVFGTE